MAGQPLVQERKVRVQQLDDAAILADHGGEEPLGLFQHRVPQTVAEAGEPLRIRRETFEPFQLQPLDGKAIDQGLGLRILQHALDLGIQVRPQLPLRSQFR